MYFKTSIHRVVLCLCFASTMLIACNQGEISDSSTSSLTQEHPFKLGKALDDSNLTKIPSSRSARSAEKVPPSNTGGWLIDTSNRKLVRSFYNSVYLASEGTQIDWSGDQNNCTSGTTSTDFKNSVVARINYFRAMAGVPANITLNSTYNTKAQQAALMMSANNSLNHNPPSSWSCYTADGDQAAGSSNISLGSNGWDAVSGQVRDNGANNTRVGHRRWLLFPQTLQMGAGDVAANGSYSAANSIWVFDGNSGNPRPTTRDDFVAWPTKGYNPYQVVPMRWSLSYPNADFSNATVTVRQDATAVPVTIDDQASPGYGENTITWHPTSMSTDYGARWPKPVSDTDYQVTVDNVVVNGITTSFSYTVTVIDPQTAAVNEETITIAGDATPIAGVSTNYSFSSISNAVAYNAIIADIDSSLETYDAEDGGTNVTDGTDPTYTLIYSGSGTNGTSVYRLAPATFMETVEFPEVYIPSANAQIQFDSKLGYATDEQTAAVQISIDDGASWKDVYKLTGTGLGSPEETSFSTHNISLAGYDNKLVKFRATYSHTGFRYTGTSASVSFLIDNIQVSNAKSVATQTIKESIGVSNFSFVPENDKEYALAARAIFWNGYTAIEWGNILFATPEADSDIDGMPDAWEILHNLNPASALDATLDADSEGLTNLEEYQNGTDPNKADSDSDGMDDKDEIVAGRDPNDPSDGAGSFIPIIIDLVL